VFRHYRLQSQDCSPLAEGIQTDVTVSHTDEFSAEHIIETGRRRFAGRAAPDVAADETPTVTVSVLKQLCCFCLKDEYDLNK